MVDRYIIFTFTTKRGTSNSISLKRTSSEDYPHRRRHLITYSFLGNKVLFKSTNCEDIFRDWDSWKKYFFILRFMCSYESQDRNFINSDFQFVKRYNIRKLYEQNVGYRVCAGNNLLSERGYPTFTNSCMSERFSFPNSSEWGKIGPYLLIEQAPNGAIAV